MARQNRFAGSGSWHHVFNRGIGKRVIFATRADYRKFTALMACAVRRGDIEIHAYSLLGTHFHLLCRVPPGGDLSRAMMRIQNAYSRWFNRRNRRDGPLFRGRFRSRPVESIAYWLTLLRYIDFNPVKARRCGDPLAYEFGSARAYGQSRQPLWLATDEVKRLLQGGAGIGTLAQSYRRFHDLPPADEEQELVEERLLGAMSADPTDDLLAASSPRFRAWMVTKAKNADGLRPSQPLASASAVEQELARRQADGYELTLKPGRKRLDGWLVIRAGLLHQFAGSSCEVVGKRLGRSNGTISRWIAVHRTMLDTDPAYAELASEVAKAALQRSHGLP